MKLIKIIENQLIDEGVYDPSIFKAIFMAGGPGSGKTYAAKKSAQGLGFKFINSDTMFEKLLKDAGLSLDMSDSNPDEWEDRMDIRSKAKNLTKKDKSRKLEGRLGVIIDGTGKDYEKIKRQRAKLEELGYDTAMILVNTPLEVAHERNQKRARTLPKDIVEDSWYAVQNNIGKFQTLFGRDNMYIVDSSSADDNVYNRLWKEVMKFSKKPVKNHIARKWIKDQLAKKKR